LVVLVLVLVVGMGVVVVAVLRALSLLLSRAVLSRRQWFQRAEIAPRMKKGKEMMEVKLIPILCLG